MQASNGLWRLQWHYNSKCSWYDKNRSSHVCHCMQPHIKQSFHTCIDKLEKNKNNSPAELIITISHACSTSKWFLDFNDRSFCAIIPAENHCFKFLTCPISLLATLLNLQPEKLYTIYTILGPILIFGTTLIQV